MAVQRDVRSGWAEHRLHPVLVIDEAHLMPDATLPDLHVLPNLDMDSRPLLSLVGVGLPELQDRRQAELVGGGGSWETVSAVLRRCRSTAASEESQASTPPQCDPSAKPGGPAPAAK